MKTGFQISAFQKFSFVFSSSCFLLSAFCFPISAFSISAFQHFIFQFRIPHSAFRILFAVSP